MSIPPPGPSGRTAGGLGAAGEPVARPQHADAQLRAGGQGVDHRAEGMLGDRHPAEPVDVAGAHGAADVQHQFDLGRLRGIAVVSGDGGRADQRAGDEQAEQTTGRNRPFEDHQGILMTFAGPRDQDPARASDDGRGPLSGQRAPLTRCQSVKFGLRVAAVAPATANAVPPPAKP